MIGSGVVLRLGASRILSPCSWTSRMVMMVVSGPYKILQGTCNCFNGGGAALTFKCCITDGGTRVSDIRGWEATHDIIDGSGIIRGSIRVAWIAWTIATRLWTCSTNKLNRSRPTTIGCSGGESHANAKRDRSFTKLSITHSIDWEAKGLVWWGGLLGWHGSPASWVTPSMNIQALSFNLLVPKFIKY